MNIRKMLIAATVAVATSCATVAPQDVTWTTYGNVGGGRHSDLRDIGPGNVTRLEVAWTYHTGDASLEAAAKGKAAFEATPIVVDGLLFVSTPFNRVIALDAETGSERWRFDPELDRTARFAEVTSRGVSTWLDGRAATDAPCRRRIVFGTLDARLFAIDAMTGGRCGDFGRDGEVSLKDGFRVLSPNAYQVTSPPAIIGDLIIVGSAIGDNRAADLERGVVRAYDARTGALRWTWDPIPATADDPAAKTWEGESRTHTGAANVWSVITADEERGLVFVPTSSPSPDFYGGMRLGDNRYANSIVALHAATGKVAWHFQVVHHDLWDYDVASQPVLATITKDGRRVPVVLAGTKMGHLFVLDRATGQPVFPVEERPVPQTDVPGERTSPTQPFPTHPGPLVPQGLTADQVWGASDADRDWCRAEFERLRSDGMFTPPTVRGSLAFPGQIGGMHWGGFAFDPHRERVIVNTNRFAMIVRLIPRDQESDAQNDPSNNRLGGEFAQQAGTPFAMFRYPFVTPGRIPCTAPPWGTLSAVDLRSGRVSWEVPLGNMTGTPDGEALGSFNLGGALIAGDLVFIGAAMDEALRAFDIETGRLLWKGALPASAQATPMTYRVGGRQFVVIAAGGDGKRLGTKMGDAVVAFALPPPPLDRLPGQSAPVRR
ncbi:MAG: pyrroloquinoline quinone-dependent dehydrogenase [Pseudonocardiales bacterium]